MGKPACCVLFCVSYFSLGGGGGGGGAAMGKRFLLFVVFLGEAQNCFLYVRENNNLIIGLFKRGVPK